MRPSGCLWGTWAGGHFGHLPPHVSVPPTQTLGRLVFSAISLPHGKGGPSPTRGLQTALPLGGSFPSKTRVRCPFLAFSAVTATAMATGWGWGLPREGMGLALWLVLAQFFQTHTHSLPPSLEPSQSSLSHNRQAPPTPPALHCPASLLGWGPLIRCSRPVPRGCSGCTAPVSPQILCPGTPPSEAWRGAILTASLETWVHQVRCRLLLSAHLARVCLWGRGTDWPRGSIWLRTARPI